MEAMIATQAIEVAAIAEPSPEMADEARRLARTPTSCRIWQGSWSVASMAW
jgi:hypothetical protein